eukprot:NODE_608_length_5442_cov_0.955830.p2 type:complete len:338 gc:universal NODE_608_length_5442_cov_0.955830:1170-2183(+)
MNDRDLVYQADNELLLTYSQKFDKESTIIVKTALDNFLYDSDFTLLLLFFKDKKLIRTQDVYPKSFKFQGELTIKVQIRHNDVSKLKEVNTALNIDVEIEKQKIEWHEALQSNKSKFLIKKGKDLRLYQTLSWNKQGTFVGVVEANDLKIPILVLLKSKQEDKKETKQDTKLMGLVDQLVKTDHTLKIDSYYYDSQMILNDKADKFTKKVDFKELLLSVSGVDNEYSIYQNVIVKAYCKMLLKDLNQEKFEQICQLQKKKDWVPENEKDLLQLIKMLVDKQLYGTAIKHIVAFNKQKLSAELYAEWIKILQLLKWDEWAKRVEQLLVLDCTIDACLF